jgi:hypothetical protein
MFVVSKTNDNVQPEQAMATMNTHLKSTRRAATLAIALAFAGVATAALARPSNPDGQLSRVGQICSSVLGVQPGQAQYDGCAESLSGSLHGANQGASLWAAHDACLDKGLKSGSADLAVCTLQSSRAKPADIKASDLTLTGVGPAPAKSYFSASNRDRFHREQLACAELGLNPVSSAFDGCVAGLRSNLFELDNPSQ